MYKSFLPTSVERGRMGRKLFKKNNPLLELDLMRSRLTNHILLTLERLI